MLKPTQSALTFHIEDAQVFYEESDDSINIWGDNNGCEERLSIEGVTVNKLFMFARNAFCAGDHVLAYIDRNNLNVNMAKEMIKSLQHFVDTTDVK